MRSLTRSLVDGDSWTLGSHGSLGFVKWSRRLTWLLSSLRHSVIQLDPDSHRTVWEADNPVENVYQKPPESRDWASAGDAVSLLTAPGEIRFTQLPSPLAGCFVNLIIYCYFLTQCFSTCTVLCTPSAPSVKLLNQKCAPVNSNYTGYHAALLLT